MRVLIVGCGYVGKPLGAKLAQERHEVFGLRRSAEGARELSELGITPVLADITNAGSLPPLGEGYDWVINCAASGGGDEASYRRLYLGGNANLAQWLRERPPARFVYTSSTGVYGQNDGSWVNEQSEASADSATAQVLLEAERLLMKAHRESGFPTIVCRLAGIYGPGRGYWFKQFVLGQARLESRGDRFLNMIHVEDVVGSIMATLAHGAPGEIYNVADDEPVSQLDFFTWLAHALGRPLPPSSITPHLARRRTTNKRVSNAKLRNQLKYKPRYPSFREGYADAVGQVLEAPAAKTKDDEQK